MPKQLQIAIDGPAGAGKSTIAKQIADKLSLLYLDTGAMYRACAYALKNVDLDDEAQVKAVVDNIDLSFAAAGKQIFLDGEDISELIRTPEISAASSRVAGLKVVREAMVAKQQQIAGENAVIMDGRDIGTVVLPQATVKIFLTASAQARAERRFSEMQQKGMAADFAEVLAEIEKRDYQDSNREHSPLKKADDAIVIDTSSMTIDDVIKNILSIIENKGLFSQKN